MIIEEMEIIINTIEPLIRGTNMVVNSWNVLIKNILEAVEDISGKEQGNDRVRSIGSNKKAYRDKPI